MMASDDLSEQISALRSWLHDRPNTGGASIKYVQASGGAWAWSVSLHEKDRGYTTGAAPRMSDAIKNALHSASEWKL